MSSIVSLTHRKVYGFGVEAVFEEGDRGYRSAFANPQRLDVPLCLYSVDESAGISTAGRSQPPVRSVLDADLQRVGRLEPSIRSFKMLDESCADVLDFLIGHDPDRDARRRAARDDGRVSWTADVDVVVRQRRLSPAVWGQRGILAARTASSAPVDLRSDLALAI